MSKKTLIIGALLAGVIGLLVSSLVSRNSELPSAGPVNLNTIDEVEQRDLGEATTGEIWDDANQVGKPLRDSSVNPTMDRWGIPSEEMVQLSPDEIETLQSMPDTGVSQSGTSVSPAAISSPGFDAHGIAPSNYSGPDPSGPEVLGSPPEASDWGSTGPAPETFDLGQPMHSLMETEAGEIGPGELEDDIDSPPPEGY